MEEEKIVKKDVENISKEDYLRLKKRTDKTRVLIIALIFIVLAMIVVLVLFLGKEDKTNNGERKPNEEINPTSIPSNSDNPIDVSIKKSVSIDIPGTDCLYDVLLDTNGNVYIDFKQIDEEADAIKKMLNVAPTYNYYGKTGKLIKLDINNIETLKTIDYGNGGAKYIVLLDKNNTFYGLIDYKVPDGDFAFLVDSKLNNVKDVYSECDYGGCMAYANAIINGKEQKIDLYSIFEMYENTD